MKIAFFVNKFPVVSQTFILNQIVDLINEGHTVNIFASGEGEKEIIHPLVSQKGLIHNTVYYGVPNFSKSFFGTKMFAYSFVNTFIALLRRPKTTIKFIYLSNFGRKLESNKVFNNVIFFLKGKELEYQIVHCHFGKQGLLAAYLKELGFLRGKIITTFHGYDMSKYVKSHGKKVYDKLFRYGDLFLPISNRWRDKLIELGCDRKKILVHKMGVDLNKAMNKINRKNCGPTKCLTIGRLIEKKGVSYGINAVSETLESHPDTEYRIVGDGPLREDLIELIDQLELNEKVKLLGWKNQEDIFSLLNESDILIAPSVTDEKGDQEGIPVVLMEAMAHGLPVLSTEHSGIPELVKDGLSGFLVPERDHLSLSLRLNYLIENPAIRKKMGCCGRDFVTENHNNEKLNRELLHIYRSVCD